MTFKSGKLIPVLLCCAVAGLMSLLQTLTHRDENFLFARRLEWMTYDWRVREATNSPYACAPNLGFVFINDETIQRVRHRGAIRETIGSDGKVDGALEVM